MRPAFFLLASLLLAQEQPPSLRGVVRDITTGSPVPAISVSVRGFGQHPQNALTNEKGEFQFNGLRPGQFIIDVHSLQFVRTSSMVQFGAIDDSGRSPDITVDVVPPSSITGTVRTADGIPIPRAQVEPVPPRRGRSGFADENGRYEVGGLAPGEYQLRARIPASWRARGLPPVAVGSSRKIAAGSRDEIVDFVFATTPLASFDGQVLDGDGKPLAPAGRQSPRVELASLDLDSELPVEDVSLDAQGRFRFDFLKPGRYRLSVRRPGLGSQAGVLTDIDIPPGGITGRKIALSGRATLRGRITTPLPSGLRMGLTLHPQPPGPGLASADIGPDGRFEIRNVQPGRWSVSVSNSIMTGSSPLPGFWAAQSLTQRGRITRHFLLLELLDGDNDPIEIEVAQLYPVAGSVVDSEGRLQSGVNVQFFRDNPMLSFPQHDGTFLLHLAPGTYKVNALRGARPLPTFQDCPTTQTIEVKGNISGLKITVCP